MRAYHIAFACFLFGVSMFMFNSLGIFGETSTVPMQYNSTADVNKTITGLVPTTPGNDIFAVFGLGAFLYNGFNVMWSLMYSTLFFPLQLVSWYNAPMWMAVGLESVLGFIYIAGFVEFISARQVGA